MTRSVTDANGVASAELLVDGVSQPLTLAADGSFSVTLTPGDGTHTLTLGTEDAVGNRAETSATVTVTLNSDDDGLTDEEEAALGTETLAHRRHGGVRRSGPAPSAEPHGRRDRLSGGTDPPRITEEIQRQESVTTELVLRLPTSPLVESRRADVVVRYAPEDR